MELHLILLGSGQDGGTPQLGSASQGAERSASSVALVTGTSPPILFDASPDIRHQHARLRSEREPDPGKEPFSRVFITHGHMGHYAGLVHFGKEAASTSGIPLHADDTVLAFLAANEPWASLFTNGNLVAQAIPDGGVDLGRVIVRAIRVPHRSDFTATSAFSVWVDDTPWALYLPDIDSWDQWADAEEVLASHALCLIDATFGSMDEIPGRSIHEIPHPLVGDTLTRFAHLTNHTEIVLTHINHSNALNDRQSDLTALALSLGFTIGADGMTFSYRATP